MSENEYKSIPELIEENKKLKAFNEIFIKYGKMTLENKKNAEIVKRVRKYFNDLKQYQPEIRERAKGILDMRDEVDQIRYREFVILGAILKEMP